MYLWATVHAVYICLSNNYNLFCIFVFLLIIEDYENHKAKVADNKVYDEKVTSLRTQAVPQLQMFSEKFFEMPDPNMSSVLEEMTQEQEKLIEEKKIITG